MQDRGVHFTLTLLILFSSLPSFFSTTIPILSFGNKPQIAISIDGGVDGRFEFNSAECRCKIDNPRIKRAYIAFQSWKKSILSDPFNFTSNWDGPDVCNYNGVFCAKSPDDSNTDTVASVDLNNVNLAGKLPVELGLLSDIAVLHLNSNRFSGVVPTSISKLKSIQELDLSNNNFAGPFPEFVLSLPNLKYLDLRYNNFVGVLPSQLFDKELDALFLNNNRFTSRLPDNFGSSPASVMVLSNNQFEGGIPSSIGKMAKTLDEIVLSNNKFTGCLAQEIGLLENAKLVDVQNNSFSGTLPMTLNGMQSIERLNLANNQFSGFVSDNICGLPKLVNFTFAYNYFNGEAKSCITPRIDVNVDDTSNCLPKRPNQKSPKECVPVVTKPIDCGNSSPSPSQVVQPEATLASPAPEAQQWPESAITSSPSQKSQNPNDHTQSYETSYTRMSPTSSFTSTTSSSTTTSFSPAS